MKNEKHPVRKDTRWEKQDYSHPGEYAITICVKDNKQILSRVVPIYEPTDVCSPSCESEQTVGAGVLEYTPQICDLRGPRKNHSKNVVCLPSCESEQTVGAGVLDRPYSTKVILTPYGKIAEKYIKQLDSFYKNIQVLKYVIMPNHIHLLLRILYDDEINELNNSGRSEIYPTNAVAFAGTPNRTPVPTNDAVTQRKDYIINCDDNNGANSLISKFVSTFKRFCNKEYGENIWQRSFYDHVIRDDNDLTGAETYISENPAKWLVREEI